LILGNRLVCERPKTTSGGGWKKELTGKEAGPPELTFFEIYKSPIVVIEDLRDVRSAARGKTLRSITANSVDPVMTAYTT